MRSKVPTKNYIKKREKGEKGERNEKKRVHPRSKNEQKRARPKEKPNPRTNGHGGKCGRAGVLKKDPTDNKNTKGGLRETCERCERKKKRRRAKR